MLLMHWLPKIPTATRFIVQSRKCSTKGLSKAVTKAFNLIFKQNKNFCENLHFRFWGAENSEEMLKDLLKVLFDLIDFSFSVGPNKKN